MLALLYGGPAMAVFGLTVGMALMFDRKDQLWRVIATHYQRPVPDNSTPERALETSVGGWRGSIDS